MRVFLLPILFCIPAIAQDPVAVTPFQLLTADSSTGLLIPCAGCSIYTYAAGTNTPLATYTDSSLGTPNTNPVCTNSSGYALGGGCNGTLSGIWVGSACYKLVAKDASAVTLWTQDHICDDSRILAALLAGPTGAAQIGYRPTGGDTTITVAADLNATLIDAGFSTFALGCASAISTGRALVITASRAIAADCAANLIFVPGGKLAPSAPVALTGTLTAPPTTIFDYGSGGTVDISGAKIAAYRPEWFGAIADGTTVATTPFARLLAAAGVGHLITLSAGTGCYLVDGVGVNPLSGQTFSGPKAACVDKQDSGAVFSNAVSATNVHFDGFTIKSTNNVATYGIYADGTLGLNASGWTFRNMTINDPATAGIFMRSAYGILIENTNVINTGSFETLCGIQMGGTFNNTINILSGTISFTTTSGVCIGAGTDNVLIQTVVLQSNAQSHIKASGPVHNLIISNNHFENGGYTTPGFDISIPAQAGRTGPSTGITITGNEFNDAANSPIFVADARGIVIENNFAESGRTRNIAQMGIATDTPIWRNNTWMQLENALGTIITSNAALPVSPTWENRFLYSTELNNAATSVGKFGTGTGSSISQDGSYLDGTPSWSISLTSPSDPVTNLSFISQSIGVFSGRLLTACWTLKTDSGVIGVEPTLGVELPAVDGIPGNLYQIGTSWQTICPSIMIGAANGAAIGARLLFYGLSGSPTKLYVYHPQVFADLLNPPNYASTRADAIIGAASDVGQTVFAELATAGASNVGQCAWIADGSTNTWGANLAGGGANSVKGCSNGSNYTVTAK